jgi:flagellar hook-basal body complex protein FliE
MEAGNAAQAFESGKEIDVTKVMLAREKASLAFEATMQIRNKLLSAYKDIMSMPV